MIFISSYEKPLTQVSAEFDVPVERRDSSEIKKYKRGPCSQFIDEELVREAAIYRIVKKYEFLKNLKFEDAIIYGTFSTVGLKYRTNLLKLNQHLPALNNLTRCEIFSILLKMTGLLPEPADDFSKEILNISERFDVKKIELPEEFKYTRPQSHPVRVLFAISAYIETLLKKHQKFIYELLSMEVKDIINSFTLHDEYFDSHYTFSRKFKKQALAGSAKSVVFIVNFIIPFALTILRKEKDLKSEEILYDIFLKIPVKEIVSPVKVFIARYYKKIKKEYEQQGLLELFNDYCSYEKDACKSCSFPAILKDKLWKKKHLFLRL